MYKYAIQDIDMSTKKKSTTETRRHGEQQGGGLPQIYADKRRSVNRRKLYYKGDRFDFLLPGAGRSGQATAQKAEYKAGRQPEMLTAMLHSSRIFSAGIYLRFP
jgi:hypothetical protein